MRYDAITFVLSVGLMDCAYLNQLVTDIGKFIVQIPHVKQVKVIQYHYYVFSLLMYLCVHKQFFIYLSAFIHW